MPKATDIRTKAGGGLTAVNAEPTASSSTGATNTAAAGNASGQTGSAVKEVAGRNLGAGHGVFAGANNGKSLVTLDYRSLVAGPGINIVADAESLTLVSTGTLSSDINQLEGVLATTRGGTGKSEFGLNSILLGNAGGPLQELTAPTAANKMLSWDGAAYAWVDPQTSSGTVTSVGLTAGSAKVTVTGATVTSAGTFTVDVNESALNINSLGGTLAVTKGGTGVTSLTAGGLVVGNGTGAVGTAPLPSAAGQVLGWSGTAYSWVANGISSVTATGSNGITATASTTSGEVSLAVSLGASGVTQGTYTYPTITVDAQGRITSASNNTIPTVSGQNLGTGGIGLFAGKTGDNLTFKQLAASAGVSVTTTADTVTVGLGVVPMANGGTGSTSYTAGSLLYADAAGFKSAPAAPSAQTSVLSHNGTTFSWIAAPTTSAVASSSTAITTSSATSGGVTTYTLGFAPSNVPLNNLGGTLDVTKGGTGATSFTAGGILLGNGTGAISATSAPASANRYLRWSGTAYEWVEILPSGVQSVTAGQGLSLVADSTETGGSITTTGTINIADTGVTAGSYTVLSGTVNAKGQLTSVSDASATVLNRANHTGNTPLNAVTGTLAVANGGTGLSTLTGQANKLLIVNGTANGFTFADQYVLPLASAGTLGGIRVGSGLAIDGAGILSATASGFSGDYNDLINKPTIPTATSQLTNDSSFVNQAALDLKANLSLVGAASGIAPLGSDGRIAATYLPSYVDDVVEAANYAALPGTGEAGKIYVTVDTNRVYRWSGSAYIEISANPGTTDAVPEGSTNLYFTNARARNAISAAGSLTYDSTTGVISYAAPTLATVATTGSYTDLTNKPTLFSGAYADLTGKPVLATVATSGSYNDLADKPTLANSARIQDATSATAFVGTAEAGEAGKVILAASNGTTATTVVKVASGATANSNMVFSNVDADTVKIAAEGAGVNVHVAISPKGTGEVRIGGGSASVTTIAADSSALDVDLKLQPKGTGVVDVSTARITNVVNPVGLQDAATKKYVDDSVAAVPTFSGNYADLTGAPVLATVATSGSYNDLLNRPVLFSGSYTDLTNKPTLFSGAYADLTGAPVLSLVATSGSYNDLLNKPTIPDAYTLPTASATVLGGVKIGTGLAIDVDGILSATSSGGTVTSVAVAAGSTKVSVSGSPITTSGTITVDVAEANLTLANIGGTVPVSKGGTGQTVLGAAKQVLRTNSGATATEWAALTAADVGGLATVATTGSYTDLINQPTIPTQYTDAMARASISTAGSLSYNSTTGVISYTAPTLATVATTGSYNDLLDTPAAYVLPTASATILGGVKVGTGLAIDVNGVLATTGANFSGDYNDLTNKPFIPTATSQLTNDSNFVNQAALDLKANLSLVGAANGIAPLGADSKIAATYLPSYVDDVLEVANSAALPATGETGKIYITVDNNKVFRWTGTVYVEIVASPGSTDAVPEGTTNLYFTTARARASISASGSLTYDSATGVMSYTAPVLATVATTGSYNDLLDQPTIPTQYTDAMTRSALSITAGTSGITYNSTTGVFDFSNITTGGSGEVNTGANVGTGEGAVYKEKVGAELRFRTLKAGSNITITQNLDDITIASTASGGGSNPAGSTAPGHYTFTITLSATGAVSNVSQITGLPAGWSATVNANVVTVTHTVGYQPSQVISYGSTTATGGAFKMKYLDLNSGNGSLNIPDSGSTTMNTTTFQFTMNNTIGSSVANGTVHIRAVF